MRRVIAAILLVAVLAVGGGIIASTAYQAGVATAVTVATGSGATVVTPVVVPAVGYGFGWHPFGFVFGIFGFFLTLFFLFVVFGLLRAIFWRAGPGRRGGWGGPGYAYSDGPSGHGHSPWKARAHDTFEAWHAEAHAAPGDPATGGSTGSAGSANTTPSTTPTPPTDPV